jgi:exodeoxyribonuclease-3
MALMHLLSWNVNGLRAVHRKGFLAWVAEAQPDILCLQETKAAEQSLPFELKVIPGYRAYFAAAERKGYSGVALYTKQEPHTVQRGFGIERFDSEGRSIIADYGDFILCNIYFPNGQMSPERLAYKLDFYESFLDYADRLQKSGRGVIVCGDVNTAHREIDLARPKENAKTSGFLPQERTWIDRFLSRGFVDTFRLFCAEPAQYTWWDLKSRARERNVGWRIDYFFVSAALQERVRAASILPQVTGSDHCPVGMDISL